MAKVSIKKNETVISKAEEEDKKAAALAANEQFEKKRAALHKMRDAWEENYPEALEALDEIKHAEDEIQEILKEAKPLMSASGEKEIGEFKIQYPMTTPTYDGKRLLKILMKLKGETPKDKADRLDLILDLFERGLITELGVDAKVAGIVKDRPGMKLLDPAWVASEPLTPRVSVPKI
jgi:hypothetical protein